MNKIKHTTVNLTDKAQEVKYDLAPIFGLKNILSAGLILFGRLSDAEQKLAIVKANSIDTEKVSQRSQDAQGDAKRIVASAEAQTTKKKRNLGRKLSKSG